MKNHAVARIILWSAVALILSGILCSVIFEKSNPFANLRNEVWRIFSFGRNDAEDSYYTDFTYEDADYQSGAASLKQKIRQIEIDWVSGEVRVEAYDGDTVEISEVVSGGNADDHLRYSVQNDTLKIKFRKSGVFRWINAYSAKKLLVQVPVSIAQDLRSVKINAVSASVFAGDLHVDSTISASTTSGDVTLEQVAAEKIYCNTTSGKLHADGLTADKVEFATVSGDCEMVGSFCRLKAESISGRVNVTSNTELKEADCSTVSGDIMLKIPESNGFTADFSAVSGKFFSAFATVASNGGDYIYGDGAGDFSFDAVSGNVKIEKLLQSGTEMNTTGDFH